MNNAVIDATLRAGEERAIEMCTEQGGTTDGMVNGVLICEIPPDEE